MVTTELTPVVTHRVRAFLAGQGVDLQPWSSLDETYAQLYGLLTRRGPDPFFWEALEELLRRIASDAADGEKRHAAPGAELLASWDMKKLVRDLRAALPGPVVKESDRPSLGAFTAVLSAQVLGGFLVLGMAAAGCVDASDDDTMDDAGTDTDADTDADTDTDWASGCGLPEAGVLYQTIAGSELDTEQKRVLCTCMADLIDNWTAGLTDLFQNGTPDQIAAALTGLVACCDTESGALEEPYSQEVEDTLIAGDLCDVPIYKGVAFPSR